MHRLKGIFILDGISYDLIYGEAERSALSRYVDFIAPPQTSQSIAENQHLLADVDVIFSGWGAPMFDTNFLNAAPNLKVIFYGAGTIGYCMTYDVWERGVRVTSSNSANAIPVAEFTLSAILFSLKWGWQLERETRARKTYPERNTAPGCFGSTIGLISLGATARALLRLLKAFDLKVLAYDPYVSDDECTALGAKRVSLEELFARSDVVSLHSPNFPETREMITGQLLASMKPGATFINTARGEIVCEEEMIEIAQRRRDLHFVLDVVVVEPPSFDSPLYTLPNIVLTPHIAGSVGLECRRMGRYMVDELERYVAGIPLQWEVTPESAALSSHRIPERPASLSLTLHKVKPRGAAAPVPANLESANHP